MTSRQNVFIEDMTGVQQTAAWLEPSGQITGHWPPGLVQVGWLGMGGLEWAGTGWVLGVLGLGGGQEGEGEEGEGVVPGEGQGYW